jgi:hypothetical protein
MTLAHAPYLPDVAAMGPVFLGAALAVGWMVAEIISTSLNSSRIAERLIRAAPLCVAGCGVAMAWPRLSAWLMRTVDALEGGAMAWPRLSAWLMRTVDALEGGAAARWLFAGSAVLTAIGMIGSFQGVGR